MHPDQPVLHHLPALRSKPQRAGRVPAIVAGPPVVADVQAPARTPLVSGRIVMRGFAVGLAIWALALFGISFWPG